MNSRLILLTFHFSILTFLLLSCQTTPKAPGTAAIETLPLESGAAVYIIVNAKQARPILDILPIEELNNRQTRQLIERTDFFAAALFPQTSGRRFQLAAWGNYPSFRAGLAFSFQRQWRIQRVSRHSYWHSAANGLSIALNSKQAFVTASTEGPVNPVTAAPLEMPEGFSQFSRASPFSCWLENPAPVISRILNDAGIPLRFPVQQFFCNLYPLTGNQYEAMIRLQFENAVQARGVAAILSLASNLSNDDTSIISLLFLANPPVVNGRNIDIKTAVLSRDDIARLLPSDSLP
jgi:hypothetical protein